MEKYYCERVSMTATTEVVKTYSHPAKTKISFMIVVFFSVIFYVFAEAFAYWKRLLTKSMRKQFLCTSTRLHADDPQMITLIDPQQELLGFVIVDEDAASLWPVLVVTRCSLHPVLTPAVTFSIISTHSLSNRFH